MSKEDYGRIMDLVLYAANQDDPIQNILQGLQETFPAAAEEWDRQADCHPE